LCKTAENTASFPIEDLDAVLIENPQVRWTVSVVSALAENGSIRMLVVTEKQYESIELLLGKLTVEEETPPTETITLF